MKWVEYWLSSQQVHRLAAVATEKRQVHRLAAVVTENYFTCKVIWALNGLPHHRRAGVPVLHSELRSWGIGAGCRVQVQRLWFNFLVTAALVALLAFFRRQDFGLDLLHRLLTG